MHGLLKKSLVVFLATSTLVCSLAACSPKDSPQGGASESAPPTESALADISEYRVVIPKNADLYTEYAAKNLVAYLKNNSNITLQIATDASAETEKELLIGATNRAGSQAAAAATLRSDEYVLMSDDESVVLYGESYMVGGAVGDLINRRGGAKDAWEGSRINLSNLSTTPEPTKFVYEQAKSAILLIGDGMGFEHINMTLAKGGIDRFSANDMPNKGQSVTRSQSVIDGFAGYTDSAASGTALATGYKTANGYLGMTPDKTVRKNVRELAHEAGAKTAILTTDYITGATPCAFLAHHQSRNDTSVLANQIDELKAQRKVDVAVGFQSDHDEFLPQAITALNLLSKKGSPFFTMMEEAQIDKHSEKNDYDKVLEAMERFNSVITYAMEFTLLHPDTVLLVTADHETGGIAYSAATDEYTFSYTHHTNANVPVFAMGQGTEYFANSTVENTCIAQFIAKIYGEESFGDPQYGKYNV